jgi:hypothetical protein
MYTSFGTVMQSYRPTRRSPPVHFAKALAAVTLGSGSDKDGTYVPSLAVPVLKSLGSFNKASTKNALAGLMNIGCD